MNEDLPPHLRERASQPGPQVQIPIELPPEEEPPPPLQEEPPRSPEPFLRRS